MEQHLKTNCHAKKAADADPATKLKPHAPKPSRCYRCNQFGHRQSACPEATPEQQAEALRKQEAWQAKKDAKKTVKSNSARQQHLLQRMQLYEYRLHKHKLTRLRRNLLQRQRRNRLHRRLLPTHHRQQHHQDSNGI